MADIEMLLLLAIGFLIVFCFFAGDFICWMLNISPDD